VGNLVELPPLENGESREGPRMGKPTPRPPGPLGLPTLSPPLVLGPPQTLPTPPMGKPSPKPPTPPKDGEARPAGTPPEASGTPSGATGKTPPTEQGPQLDDPATPTRIKAKQPGTEKQPLRAVRLESDEVTVFVECYPEYVVVYPSKKSFGPAALRNGSFLTQVKQGLSRPLLGGGTPKLQVRFLIRPGGERMLHPAQENLRGLRVPMTQYQIQPEDDVQKIVTQR
jgi:hypothetical protein